MNSSIIILAAIIRGQLERFDREMAINRCWLAGGLFFRKAGELQKGPAEMPGLFLLFLLSCRPDAFE